MEKLSPTQKEFAMTYLNRLGLSCLLACLPLLVIAADAAQVDAAVAAPERFKVLLENEHVRVLEYALQPGERDQWHTHPAKVSYVVGGGKLRIHLADGTSFDADEKAGTASWMEALPRHYAENTGSTAVRIVLVEVKSAQGK